MAVDPHDQEVRELFADPHARDDGPEIVLVDLVAEVTGPRADREAGLKQAQPIGRLVGRNGRHRQRHLGPAGVDRIADLFQRLHLVRGDHVQDVQVQWIESRRGRRRAIEACPRRVRAGVNRIHADGRHRPFGRRRRAGHSSLGEVPSRPGVKDACRLEQPVGFEHPLRSGVQRVVVGGRHHADAHPLQVVGDRLGPPEVLVERPAEAGQIDDRPFHVGVGHVRFPHHFGERLIAGVTVRECPADDDVADRSERERLRDLHGELFGRIVADLRQHDIAARRSLTSKKDACGDETGDDHAERGQPGSLRDAHHVLLCARSPIISVPRLILEGLRRAFCRPLAHPSAGCPS